MDRVAVLFLQVEVLALASRLRRLGHSDAAVLVEGWAASSDFADQVGASMSDPAGRVDRRGCGRSVGTGCGRPRP